MAVYIVVGSSLVILHSVLLGLESKVSEVIVITRVILIFLRLIQRRVEALWKMVRMKFLLVRLNLRLVILEMIKKMMSLWTVASRTKVVPRKTNKRKKLQKLG